MHDACAWVGVNISAVGSSRMVFPDNVTMSLSRSLDEKRVEYEVCSSAP